MVLVPSFLILRNWVKTTLDTLPLEAVKKTFHRRVIIAISRSTHTHQHACLSQKRLIALTGVGTATIRLKEQSRLCPTPSDRHLERLDDQRGVLSRGHGPPDDHAREQVQHHGQVEPALGSPD